MIFLKVITRKTTRQPNMKLNGLVGLGGELHLSCSDHQTKKSTKHGLDFVAISFGQYNPLQKP